MSDIIERAEALNPHNHYAWRGGKAAMFPELVAELKAARAENERLRRLHAPMPGFGGDYSGGSDV